MAVAVAAVEEREERRSRRRRALEGPARPSDCSKPMTTAVSGSRWQLVAVGGSLQQSVVFTTGTAVAV